MRIALKKTGFLLLCFLFFFCGIIRHDVKEKEYIALASHKQFDCVGRVAGENDAPAASCVLIDPGFVLSAAHVFMKNTYREDSGMVQGHYMKYKILLDSKPIDVTNVAFIFNGISYHGKSIKIFPAYLDTATKHACDLAIIELQEKVTSIKPALIGTSQDELHANIIGVGYGVSGIASEPQDVKALKKKIAGENVIDSLSGYKFNGQPTLLMADFDHPTNKSCNRMGSATPRPLEFSVSGGDSGGGLFRKTKKRMELIGITSGSGVDIQRLIKTGYYGQTMAWTRVSVFLDWIRYSTEKN